MVPEEEGLALLGLVQNAGAVFIGPWSPASMGDYIAGPNHVLPTNRTARFASALRADDFRKHVHAVRVTPDALRVLGPLVVTLAETEGLPAHADSVRRRLDALARAGPDVSAVPPVRPDLQLAEGYHSPQVEAEVRLNTNESPFAPPDAWRDELLAALAEISFHRYPDRPATELREAVAELHGVTAGRGVLRQRLERGAAEPAAGLRGPRPPRPGVRADLRAALPHRPHHGDRGGRRARATTTS